MSREKPSGDGENWFVRFLKRKWLAIILVILVVIVAVQNVVASEKSTIFLLWGQVSLPTWLILSGIFVIGGIVGWILARNRAARRARK
jgi:lipopolysaccharide assembly protein A